MKTHNHALKTLIKGLTQQQCTGNKKEHIPGDGKSWLTLQHLGRSLHWNLSFSIICGKNLGPWAKSAFCQQAQRSDLNIGSLQCQDRPTDSLWKVRENEIKIAIFF